MARFFRREQPRFSGQLLGMRCVSLSGYRWFCVRDSGWCPRWFTVCPPCVAGCPCWCWVWEREHCGSCVVGTEEPTTLDSLSPGSEHLVLGSCSNSSFGTTAVCERRCVFYLLPTWCITQHAFPTRLSFVHNSRGRLWNLRISAKTRIRICPPPAPRAPCVCLPPLATLDFHASHFKLDRSLSLKAKRT